MTSNGTTAEPTQTGPRKWVWQQAVPIGLWRDVPARESMLAHVREVYEETARTQGRRLGEAETMRVQFVRYETVEEDGESREREVPSTQEDATWVFVQFERPIVGRR